MALVYKWKAEITLNCGKEIVGWYESKYDSSEKSAEALLTGDVNTLHAIGSLDNKKQIFFRLGDVSSAAICVLEE